MCGLGFAFGWLRGRWVRLLLFAGLMWVFIKLAPLMWMMVKFLAVMLPVWLLLALFDGRRHQPYQYSRHRTGDC